MPLLEPSLQLKGGLAVDVGLALHPAVDVPYVHVYVPAEALEVYRGDCLPGKEASTAAAIFYTNAVFGKADANGASATVSVNHARGYGDIEGNEKRGWECVAA
ncbi:MAG: hypothetical protein V3U52_06650 [Thermoplasmata archaeon]